MDWWHHQASRNDGPVDALSGLDESLSILSDSAANRRRRLIEGVIFSKRFILSYQAVLIAIVLAFTLRHWFGKLARWRTRSTSRRTPRKDVGQSDKSSGGVNVDGSTSSSSSSTLVASEAMPHTTKDTDDEHSPLLHVNRHRSRHQPIRSLRAPGMYQPPSIPIVNKILPSNATTALILALIGIQIFYSLYHIDFEISQAFVFADRVGLLFVANLPWLYILAAKNQPIRALTGYSYENLNILHRRLGEVLCLLALLHGAFMLVVWSQFFRPTGMTLWHFLSLRIILLGTLALVSYELLYVTSLASFRRWWYEMFLGLHIVLQAAGLVLLYFHHRGGRVYAATALAIFLVDRLVFRMLAKTRSVQADLQVMADGETVLVSAAWPVTSRWSNLWTSLLGLNTRYGWKPTEHVFLTVPSLAGKHIIQAHPFTIASAAPEGDQTHAWFNLIIRAHDGFTQDLLQHAKAHTSATIRIDGPYGSLHALDMMHDSEISLVVVGGSGIAVAYPLIWTLLQRRRADAENLREDGRMVGLIWIVHEASHISWIGQERLDELVGMGLVYCIPEPTSEAGRPDVAQLTRIMVREMTGGLWEDGPKVGVVVSGPDGMNRAVRNTCASMAREGWDIDVAVEKYGW